MEVAGMSVEPSSFTNDVRVARFPACAVVDTTTPAGTVTVQMTPEDIAPPPTSNRRVAVVSPELENEPIKEALPHPLVLVVPTAAPKTKFGNTKSM